MKFFIKLNVISFLYAMTLFIATLLMINVYRISRVTGWELDFVMNTGIVIYIIGFILFTVLFIYIARKWMENRKAIFWSCILWFPYYILLVFINASLFPINNPADQLAAGNGFIVLGALVFYPVYLLLINVFGTGGGVDGDKKIHIRK